MIAIPNMEKPKGCRWCPLNHDSMCYVIQPYKTDETNGEQCRNDCPLIEIDLVRCEECKYVGTDATCCLVCCRDGMGLKPYHVYHDDFCSYGERRADETQP